MVRKVKEIWILIYSELGLEEISVKELIVREPNHATLLL
jgi:hypothetical protein